MSMVVVGVAGIAVSAIGGIMGSMGASARAREAARERARLQAQLNSLENSRQSIINPYETTKDLSYMMSNAYANIGVATKAAEFEAEQVDISLANTLDIIKETGSSGSATALANAALKSKQGISADLEKQESENEKLRAQGEADLQRMKIAEAQRMQAADAAGKQFVFNTRENREIAKMDRIASQLSGAEVRHTQAIADQTGALAGTISGITSSLGTIADGYATMNAGVNPGSRGW